MSEMRFVRNARGKEQLVIDDAKLRFHNFAGEQTEFNVKGNRNIDIILPDNEIAVEMGQKGWNVKIRKPRDPEEDPYYTLNVKINLDSKWPPDFYQYNGRQRIDFTLDQFIKQAEMESDRRVKDGKPGFTQNEIMERAKADFGDAVSRFDRLSSSMTDIGIVINGSEWESNFGHGIKAYLDEYHFRLIPSVFGNKYAVDTPEFEPELEEVPFK